jgi:hypothetical protein
MNRILRNVLVPAAALLGTLVAMPAVASADVGSRADARVSARRDHERERFERERLERERFERERLARERFERERIERERLAREHAVMCVRAADAGASAWRLRELGCYVR